MTLIGNTKYYFWVGNKSGYIWSSIKDYKLVPIGGERLKYLGFSYEMGWPKKLNTGRVLFKPNPKDRNKKKKNRKLSLVQKTDTNFLQQL